MLTRRIIPCLDVLNGRVVVGRNIQRQADAGDPVELAERYSKEGADELVLLDISATADQRRPFFDVVGRVARRISIPLTAGGGIRTIEDILQLLRSGADKVSLNTILIDDPLLLARAAPRVGSQALVAAMDVRRSGDAPSGRRKLKTGDSESVPESLPTGRRSGKKSETRSRAPGSTVPAASDGSGYADRPARSAGRSFDAKGGRNGPEAGGWVIQIRSRDEETELDAIEWARTVADCGAGELLVTSIDQAGTKQGYDLELLRELTWRVNVPLIVSGGAGTREQIAEALREGQADAVVAATALHANEIKIPELKSYLRSKGIPVRL